MSKEVKFRAWDKREKVMFVDITPLKDTSTIPIYAVKRGNLIWMQYTGLKDKNGKEIYEGDIVRFAKAWIGVIKYRHGKYWIHSKTGIWFTLYDYYDPMHDDVDVEIVGNMFENPELLKVAR